MIDELETSLRDALARRAAEVPAGATVRLLQIDYRPRGHAVGRPAAFGALAGAVGSAVAVASVIGLGAGASNAFAGWTSSPAAPPGGQTAKAIAACRARLMAARLPVGRPGPTPVLSSSGLTPVLTDTRGPFTFVIFAGGERDVSCITGPAFSSVSGSAGSGIVRVRAGHVELSSDHFTSRDGRPYTVVEGHTAADVTGTTLLLSDGSRVKASTGNGWFAAWWPGATDATAATVTTPGGAVTQHLRTGGPVSCGQGPCSSAGSVSGSSASVTSGGGKGSGLSAVSVGG